MKLIYKFLKISGISLIVITVLLFIAPYFFPHTIGNAIKYVANKNIKGDLNFSKSRLSFFHHFPSLTLTIYNVQLKGSAPFATDTLVQAKELSFGLNLASLIKGEIKVKEIYLEESAIQILVDSAGNANYNIYQPTPNTNNKTTTAADTTATLEIEKIVIEKSSLIYDDASLPMYINAQEFEYIGKGDLSKAIFDLTSNIKIGKIDFEYGKQKYFIAKTLKANLITKINTNSLAFNFEKNDILINKLPLNLTGTFEFLKDGYAMNFAVNSLATELEKIVTALPPELNTWVSNTNVKGTADITIELAGKYIASTKTMPSLKVEMGIRSGSIAYKNAPVPLNNIFLNSKLSIPKMQMDSLQLQIDSVYCSINKDFVSGKLLLQGTKQFNINASLHSDIDIELLDKAIGYDGADFKGRLKINATCNGIYKTAIVAKNIREKDTIISSIPTYNVKANLQNGFLKFTKFKEPITNVQLNATAVNTSGKPTENNINISNININLLKNYIKGNIAFDGSKNNNINSNLQVACNLQDIEKFHTLNGLQLKGLLKSNIITKGTFNIAAKQFPSTKADVDLSNGFIKTTYYPNPIQNIETKATVSNENGNANNTEIKIKSCGFNFENNPFTLTAYFKNLLDVSYVIDTKGIIDIGKIYKVFAIQGINTNGIVEAKLHAQGKQSYAEQGLYNKLKNSGTIKVKQIGITHENFPKPFLITNGVFTLENDKVNLSKFYSEYGNSNFTMNGSLENIINYVFSKKAVLKGNFIFNSNGIFVDELMAFNGTTNTANNTSSSSGVIIIPKNIDITLQANADKVLYKDLPLQNVKGTVVIKNGSIQATDLGFSVIDAVANMTGTYKTLSTNKAAFSYNIKSENFDIHQAYKKIDLFKQLVTGAKYCKGVVGIDYAIEGKLNSNMMPIYPSITGGGSITVHDIKIAGMKLWTAVSKATNKDSINNPTVKQVTIKTTIKNNIINIERTKMRIMGFRPRIEGQVNFDGQYNLKMRLGLPPLGIFGIPLSITGSGTNPKVKVGRSKKEDELQEQVEED